MSRSRVRVTSSASLSNPLIWLSQCFCFRATGCVFEGLAVRRQKREHFSLDGLPFSIEGDDMVGFLEPH